MSKNLNSVKVIFADSQYNYETSVSAETTKASAEAYFLNTIFNVGKYPNEVMKECIAVEFTNNNTFKVNHIAGPWNYKLDGFKITIGNKKEYLLNPAKNHDYTICEINDNSLQAEANAKLISKAPELLISLSNLYDSLKYWFERSEDKEGANSLMMQKAKELINTLS